MSHFLSLNLGHFFVDISIAIVYYLAMSLVQKEVSMQYNTEIPIYLQVIEDLKKKMVQGLSLIHISEPTRLRRSRMPSSA